MESKTQGASARATLAARAEARAEARARATLAVEAAADLRVPPREKWPKDGAGRPANVALGLCFPVVDDAPDAPEIGVVYFWPLTLADLKDADGLGKMQETAHFIRRACHLTENVANRLSEVDTLRANEVLQDFFAGCR